MKKFCALFFATLFLFCLTHSAFPQDQNISFSSGPRIKLGAHFEYFQRKTTWDDKQHTSDIKSTLFALNAEFEIDDGFAVSAIVGYTLTNYDSLVFRQLPYSVELNVGNIGGYILGAGIRKSLIYANNLEVGLQGQFLYQMGIEKTWDLPMLSVSGSVTGKPIWMRVCAGPYLKFTGLASFSPYLAVYYNNMWGKFKMEQTIQSLEGMEEKEIRAKSLIDITLGSILALSHNFTIKGELHLLPYDKGMDLGAVAVAAFAF